MILRLAYYWKAVFSAFLFWMVKIDFALNINLIFWGDGIVVKPLATPAVGSEFESPELTECQLQWHLSIAPVLPQWDVREDRRISHSLQTREPGGTQRWSLCDLTANTVDGEDRYPRLFSNFHMCTVIYTHWNSHNTPEHTHTHTNTHR